ncbi:MAG: FG-GAP repeat domain-containing protein [Planctomycetota bacterium]
MVASAPLPASAQAPDLAAHFGFQPLEIVKIGRRAGPIIATDMDGDGLGDLVVVNNHDSRIEIHRQRRGATPDAAPPRPARVNEFPEHWRFERILVSVNHRVTALVAHDFDGDGRRDLVYAGSPPEVVFLRQTSEGAYDVARRHRVKNLTASRDGLAIADVQGDTAPELLAVVGGRIRIWPLLGDDLGPHVELSANQKMIGFVLEDFSGNGRLDVAGLIPDDPAPVRIWFGDLERRRGVLGPQIRFEMPPLVECEAARLPSVAAARLATIERPSKRIVISEAGTEAVPTTGHRDAALWIHGFSDAGNRQRDYAVVDLDGDGLLDLVATDTEANAIVAYRQDPGRGFDAGRSFPSLTELTYLVAGEVDGDEGAELFVLSEKEGVVGRSDVRDGEIGFPSPISISAGHTPTALNLVELEHGVHLAVVAKKGRDYVVDLLGMDGHADTIELGKLSRSPESIVALDADQDGLTDLLLFTREKPMTMLRATEDGFTLMESKDMGQFGLVKAARSDNIAVSDVDGDDKEELLVAHMNYVRAVRYEAEPDTGTSPGWQVVEQINARDSTSELVSLALRERRIVAADRENDRLVVLARDADDAWTEVESINVRGFDFTSIHAGNFSGDGRESILAVGKDGFAVIRLAGERTTLEEVASWRSDDERRLAHELSFGDVNGDGFTDMVALDAGEQMCEIFTFTESGRLLYATGFQVFETRLFSGGDSREYEPSQAIIEDVTGDGADDLILLAHDRVLLYPQMTE